MVIVRNDVHNVELRPIALFRQSVFVSVRKFEPDCHKLCPWGRKREVVRRAQAS